MKLRKVIIPIEAFGGMQETLRLIEATDPDVRWQSGNKPTSPLAFVAEGKVLCISDSGYMTHTGETLSQVVKRRPDYTPVKKQVTVEFVPDIPETVQAHGRTYKLVEE